MTGKDVVERWLSERHMSLELADGPHHRRLATLIDQAQAPLREALRAIRDGRCEACGILMDTCGRCADIQAIINSVDSKEE